MWAEIIRAIADRTWTLIGVLVALVAYFHADKPFTRRFGIGAAGAFALLFVVLAVTDTVGIARRYKVAEELAGLRHTARKRYTEWWTFCQDPTRSAAIEKEAEEVRLTIIATLTKKASAAEADYFNTPKATEPPPPTTLVNCPQGVKINELAYRIDRLGEIIQRLKAKT